eukprot:267449-Chlamydomonas_euryale.AAC.3
MVGHGPLDIFHRGRQTRAAPRSTAAADSIANPPDPPEAATRCGRARAAATRRPRARIGGRCTFGETSMTGGSVAAVAGAARAS